MIRPPFLRRFGTAKWLEVSQAIVYISYGSDAGLSRRKQGFDSPWGYLLLLELYFFSLIILFCKQPRLSKY